MAAVTLPGKEFRCARKPPCSARVRVASKWDRIKAGDEGWFFQKDGTAWCPKHTPAWVAEWRRRKSLEALTTTDRVEVTKALRDAAEAVLRLAEKVDPDIGRRDFDRPELRQGIDAADRMLRELRAEYCPWEEREDGG